MATIRPCTAACVIDGRLVMLTFYPGSGVLRIADSSGVCLSETRWGASWRALLDEFRGYYEAAEHGNTARGIDDIVARLGERAQHIPTQSALA
ncbi:hypothetical protein LJ655_01450 [Paraburkholderia sp. MMS20-SJTN17]|uniref:Uncharacterized protein n=1 Tax=Paraburkholderia translucens TaxID=2886945 RepID=A0ABS8K775_9BURK|nr:hypothetical protein [Paraburkholderia sp. MMS20-SJTN17]MCC8400569.1 hypothetical protein [Paraburkholderia sp. MMS20-SJTN17]